MTIAERKLTYADIDKLPSGSYEIIDGKRLSMSPAGFQHGLFEGRFYKFLVDHRGESGWAAVGEVGIILRKNPLRVRAADVVYISKKAGTSQPVKMLETPPELVIEILSEDISSAYINEKVSDYLNFGIGRVVLVDPENEKVVVHRPGATAASYSFADEFELLDGLRLCVADLLM